MSKKRTTGGVKKWVIEAVSEEIHRGETTLERVREKNPALAAALEKTNLQRSDEQQAQKPYSLGLWEGQGVVRVYINGGGLGRDDKVWCEADANDEIMIRGSSRDGWLGVRYQAQAGEKPWEFIALSAFKQLGVDITAATFDDLIAAAKLLDARATGGKGK